MVKVCSKFGMHALEKRPKVWPQERKNSSEKFALDSGLVGIIDLISIKAISIKIQPASI